MPDFGRWTASGGDPSLNEINRTDRFLDALGNQQAVYSTDPSEAELAHLLADWRDEIRTPPLMKPVTPRDAAAALTRAVQSRKRTRTSMAVVGSVAAAVLCLGGFGAVVAAAGPGDALYGLHTMLFGESPQTRSENVTLASQQLAEVQQLIDQGQWQAAQDKLQAVTTTVATVNDVDQKQQLVNQWQQLTVKVDAKDPNATLPPGAPPPPMPTPMVVDQNTTTTSTTSSSAGGSSSTTSPSSGTSTPGTSPSSSPTDTTPTSGLPTTTSAPGPLPPTTTVTTVAPTTPTQLATSQPSQPSSATPPTSATPQPSTPPPSSATPQPSTPQPSTPQPSTPLARTPLVTPSAAEQQPATTQPATTQQPVLTQQFAPTQQPAPAEQPAPTQQAPRVVVTTTTFEMPMPRLGGPH